MKRPYRLLAAVPAVGMLSAGFVVNRVEPYVLGMPLLLAWIVGWVVATSAIMGLILVLDRANDRNESAPTATS